MFYFPLLITITVTTKARKRQIHTSSFFDQSLLFYTDLQDHLLKSVSLSTHSLSPTIEILEKFGLCSMIYMCFTLIVVRPLLIYLLLIYRRL